MRLRKVPAICLGAICLLPLATAAAAAESPLAGLSFLVGRWQAAGTGDPGRSTGEFSFEWAADRHALVRRNEAVASTGRHEDIMLVYAQPDGTVHAVYTDNEGHTIHYGVTLEADRRHVVFESAAGAGPRFRLWYRAQEDGSLATGFEIAPPGSSEFKTYLEGVAHRE